MMALACSDGLNTALLVCDRYRNDESNGNRCPLEKEHTAAHAPRAPRAPHHQADSFALRDKAPPAKCRLSVLSRPGSPLCCARDESISGSSGSRLEGVEE